MPLLSFAIAECVFKKMKIFENLYHPIQKELYKIKILKKSKICIFARLLNCMAKIGMPIVLFLHPYWYQNEMIIIDKRALSSFNAF